MTWFRRHYGAGPLHLLSLIACAALVAYIATQLVASGPITRIVIWFAGSLIVHDFVLWPLYALADRAGVKLARRDPSSLPKVPWINHLRIPIVLSATLLAVSFPLVLRLSAHSYHSATGLSESPFLGRWLLITGGLFATSAILYAIRLGTAQRRTTDKVTESNDPQPTSQV